MSSWKSLEDHVRGIAKLRWNADCRPEHVGGVDFDGVVHVSADEVVLIEITKERTLQKVRDDLNKINPTKLRLATEGMICRGFIVLEEEPTNSMVEAGEKSHISVLSARSFEKSFFDFESYHVLRSSLPFGSAVDSKTGENDTRAFVPVVYSEVDGQRRMDVAEIIERLGRGNKIVLTGDFGTGKSRCVREVFTEVAKRVRAFGGYPVAINLRDHWSSSNALEILAGHLGNVSLASSVDNVVRLLNGGHLILLLDGFDEIGAQTHDTRVDNRKELRRHAVRGLRDLLMRTRAGVLVTGRSHFFDSDEEMLQALGLGAARNDLFLLASPEEFSVAEGEKYLHALGVNAPVPAWLPRKPLVFQVLVELDPDETARILHRRDGEFHFWGMFIYAICMRESRVVANSIAPQTVQLILLNLAAKSRISNAFRGRLSPRDIDEAYEAAVGSAPDQTGRQLLARMCTLGRIEPESPDRQFVDYGIVDVLRAEHLVFGVAGMSDKENQRQWTQSLRLLGAAHAATLVKINDLEQSCFSFLRKFGATANTKQLGELVSVLTIFGPERMDFQGLALSKTEIPILNLSDRVVANLTVQESFIQMLVLHNSRVTDKDGLTLDGCLVGLAGGVSGEAGLPPWIKATEVIEFDRLSNAARIQESPVAPQQKVLLGIVHKIFFQPGAGREEGALLKGGYGQKYSPKLVDGVIRILLREGLVERFKGDDGWIYKPVRRHTERLSRLRSELTLSEDPLWTEVLSIRF